MEKTVLSSQDCWTLAHIAQFHKILSDVDIEQLLKQTSPAGSNIVKAQLVFYKENRLPENKSISTTILGFANWLKSFRSRKAKLQNEQSIQTSRRRL